MQKKQRRMKKTKHIRLPIHVYLGYLLVAALVFTGVTFSKYITSTNAGDSARAATFGDLTLTEEDKPEQFIIAPGVDIKKDPRVSFAVNKESEAAAYVFVDVTVDNWEFDDKTNGYTIKNQDKTLLSWSVDPNWNLMYNDIYTHQIFYRHVNPGEKLENVPFIKDGKITVSDNIYASDLKAVTTMKKTITFKCYAAQDNGTSAGNIYWNYVWHIVKPNESN